jgi:hypothetical protein
MRFDGHAERNRGIRCASQVAMKYFYNDARSLPLQRFNALIRRRSGRGMIVNDTPTIWRVAED